MWNVIRPVALLLVLTTGCEVVNLSGPGADQGLPELHGKDIDAADLGGSLNWSPDGRELGFITNSYRTAQTYRVENGDFRLLFTLDGGDLHEVGLSADGAESFTTSSGGTPELVIRRHSTQGTITLTNRGTGGALYRGAEGHAVLPSPTQPVAAFTALPDSLFRIVRGSAPRLLGTGCLGIIAWSPDESQLLCMSVRDRGGYAVFRVDGGASTPLALPQNVTGYARFILWGAAGIQIVFSDIFAARIYDVSTTRSRTIIPAGSLTESVRMNRMSWSANGAKLAYGSSYCAQTQGLLGCARSQWILYVSDVQTGVATRVAVHADEPVRGGLGSVALSPDASRLAYVMNGRLNLLDLK